MAMAYPTDQKGFKNIQWLCPEVVFTRKIVKYAKLFFRKVEYFFFVV